jgi:hypothetical protein
MSMIRDCVIITPVAQSIEPACESGLRELEQRGYTVWRVRGYSAIDLARNRLASDALAQGFAEIFWIDADIGFKPEAVERIRSHGLPICCGIYVKKGQRELAMHALPGATELAFGVKGSITEVQYAGCGFMHVRREVFESIRSQLDLPMCNAQFAAPLIPYFQPLIIETVAGSWYLAEDFSFCERARRCGYHIMADTTIRLFHYGNYGYSWEEAGIEQKRYGTFVYRPR